MRKNYTNIQSRAKVKIFIVREEKRGFANFQYKSIKKSKKQTFHDNAVEKSNNSVPIIIQTLGLIGVPEYL